MGGPKIAISPASFSFPSLAFYCKAQGMAAVLVSKKYLHAGDMLRFFASSRLVLE